MDLLSWVRAGANYLIEGLTVLGHASGAVYLPGYIPQAWAPAAPAPVEPEPAPVPRAPRVVSPEVAIR